MKTVSVILVVCITWVYSVTAVRIIGHSTSLEIINGIPRHTHHATIQCTAADADAYSSYTVTDTSGTVHEVSIKCPPPEHHFDQTLRGWVPRFQYPISTKVCLTGVARNTSQLYNDNGQPASTIGDINEVDEGQGLQRRRLLSIDRIGPNTLEEEQHLRNMEQQMNDIKFVNEDYGMMPPNDIPASYFKSESSVSRNTPLSMRPSGSQVYSPARRKLLTIWNTFVGDPTNLWFGATFGAYGAYKGGAPALKKMYSKLKLRRQARAAREIDAKNNAQRAITEEPTIDTPARIADTEAEDAFVASNKAAIAENFGAEATAVDVADSSAALIATEGLGASLFTPAAGIAIGVGVSLLVSKIFGGNKSNKALANALRAIYKAFGNVQDQFNIQRNINAAQQEFNVGVQNEFASQNQINEHLENQVNDNTNAIEKLGLTIDQYGNALTSVENQVVSGFSAFGTQLQADADFSQQIWNSTIDLHNEVETQLRQIAYQVSKIAWNVRNLEVDLEHVHRRTSLRRALIKLFHRVNDVALSQNSVAFLDYVGVAPLDQTEFDKLNTEAGAFSFGSVIAQRTVLDMGDYYGQAFNLTMICDPLFLLDRVVQGLDFETMFQWLGPENCTGALETDPWNCTCAIKVEGIQCKLRTPIADYAYPWIWNSTGAGTPTWMEEPGITDFCLNPVSAIDKGTVDSDIVITTIDGMTSWVNSLCAASETVVNPTAVADPSSKIRVFGSYWPRYLDMELNTTTIPDVCNGNFAAVLSDANSASYLSYAIYKMQSLNYYSHVDVRLTSLEEHVYGRVPSDLTYVESPFNSEANTQQTYACSWFTYAKINPPGTCSDAIDPGYQCDKVRLYNLEYVGEARRVSVLINGTEIMNTTADVGSFDAMQQNIQSNVGSNPGHIYNLASVTTSVMVDEEARAILPDSFLKLGPVPGREQLDGTIKVYDVPFGLISGAPSPNSRFGHTDYIFQPSDIYGHTTPFSLKDWKGVNNVHFDARGVGASPHLYARKLTQISADTTDLVCSDFYEYDGTTLNPNATANFDWCRILRWYRVEPVNSGTGTEGQTGLIFRPENYIITAEITVPGGTWKQTVLSYCPDSVQVHNVNGDAYVTINTTMEEPVTIEIIVTNRDGTPSCVSSEQVTYSASIPIPTKLYKWDAACGSLYLNVRTLDNNQLCYEQTHELGIPLNVSHTMFTPNRQAEITSAVANTVDRAMRDIIDQANQATDYALELERISNYAEDDAAIEKQVDDAYAARKAQLEKMRTKEDYNEEHFKQSLEEAQKSAEAAKADAKAARTERDAVNKFIKQLNIEELSNNITMNVISNLDKAFNGSNDNADAYLNGGLKAAIQAAIKALEEDDGGCGGSHSSLASVITVPLCYIENLLRRGLGELWSALESIFIIVIAVVGAVIAIRYCIKFAKHHHSGGADSLPFPEPIPVPQPTPYPVYTQAPPPSQVPAPVKTATAPAPAQPATTATPSQAAPVDVDATIARAEAALANTESSSLLDHTSAASAATTGSWFNNTVKSRHRY